MDSDRTVLASIEGHRASSSRRLGVFEKIKKSQNQHQKARKINRNNGYPAASIALIVAEFIFNSTNIKLNIPICHKPDAFPHWSRFLILRWWTNTFLKTWQYDHGFWSMCVLIRIYGARLNAAKSKPVVIWRIYSEKLN